MVKDRLPDLFPPTEKYAFLWDVNVPAQDDTASFLLIGLQLELFPLEVTAD